MSLVCVHPVNFLLINLVDRESLELEAGAELSPGHSELSGWSNVRLKESDWSMVGMKASYLLMSHLGTIVHFCTEAARLMALLLARWMPSSMALKIITFLAAHQVDNVSG